MGKNNKKKTTEEFKSEVSSLVGDEYSVLGEYVNSKTKIKIRHNSENCSNNEFEMIPNAFLSGQRCRKCGISKRVKSITKTHSEFISDFHKIFDKEEYEVLGLYKDSHTRIEVLHKVCGNRNMMLPYNLLYSKASCLNCKVKNNGIKQRKSTDNFKEEVYKLVSDEYTVLGEYTTAVNKISIKHNVCNNEYDVTPNKFLLGRRCPRCNDSKGEKEINKLLNELLLDFKPQYTFSDCKNKYVLPFDFAVFKDDSIYIIEYHGEQHYEAYDFYGGEKGFEYRKLNDKIKKDYCESNNIKFLEIPYWEFDNLQKIVTEFLNDL